MWMRLEWPYFVVWGPVSLLTGEEWAFALIWANQILSSHIWHLHLRNTETGNCWTEFSQCQSLEGHCIPLPGSLGCPGSPLPRYHFFVLCELLVFLQWVWFSWSWIMSTHIWNKLLPCLRPNMWYSFTPSVFSVSKVMLSSTHCSAGHLSIFLETMPSFCIMSSLLWSHSEIFFPNPSLYWLFFLSQLAFSASSLAFSHSIPHTQWEKDSAESGPRKLDRVAALLKSFQGLPSCSACNPSSPSSPAGSHCSSPAHHSSSTPTFSCPRPLILSVDPALVSQRL